MDNKSDTDFVKANTYTFKQTYVESTNKTTEFHMQTSYEAKA